MKTTLLYLMLLASLCLSAQQSTNTSFGTQMSSTFANLDKTRVPYGMLSDFSMEFTALPAFQGTLNDSSYVHPGTLKQLYKTLLFSRVTTSTQGFVPYNNFENNWENARKKKTIVLSGLFYRYSKFLDNAYPDKITISNNKIYDKYVNGIWQNPYHAQKAFAISPSTINYKSLDMLVKFPASLWYSNVGSQVQSIQINFNDGGGYQTLNPGHEKYIQYSSAGVKIWVYKLTLSTGEILYSHSKINVDMGISSRPYGSKTSHTGDRPGVDTLHFTATTPHLGKFGNATVLINYGNTVDQIRKPLIIAEGLDMGAVTSPEEPFGNSDIENFENTVLASDSEELGDIVNANEGILNDQEYDIIYVNWSNGTDYLQRNAYVLQEVIKWVNEEKAKVGSTTPNVVLGQSMGGVIARYALKDMENKGLPHDTRTYISHDAPHLGANVPLGYQFAARHGRSQYVQSPFQLLAGDVIVPLFNDGVGVSDYLELLDQPAAKQLLVQRVNTNYTSDNITHLEWQTELRNMGYPQLTERNVSIANGNQCAITQGFYPANTLLSINGFAKTGWLTDMLTNFTGYGVYANNAIFLAATIFTIEPGFLFGLLPGNSKLTADINIKALPAYGQTAQIYSGKLTFTKKLLWLININVNLTDRSFDPLPIPCLMIISLGELSLRVLQVPQ
ncbi:hypothetical protein ACKGJN_15575 [Gillisia sp. Q332]|uniref:hypothetical protein n=1 Tax=Gillisia xinjiangensis TaxID=3384765 RepID=UPI00391DE1F1